ncbi:MAG: hypothetical protein LBM75_01880 [Myxococcales bacterium]|jgi:alpha-tubulin suppressor-like RCC1 family protein|nr:hypothetical protein [Myxococcales bacterium]
MKKKTLAICLGALVLAASACSHEVYYDYEGAKNTLFSVSGELPGRNCSSGGQRLQFGQDLNHDGQLGWDEVTSTQYLCDGEAGSTALIVVTELTGGIVCPYGGQRLDLGLDADRDGALASDEIHESHYICKDSRAEGWSTITQIAAMEDFTCALLANQDVACWGRSIDLTDQAAAPAIVAGLSKASQAAPGCALIPDGTVECWSGIDATPRRVPNLWEVKALAGNPARHACAVLKDETAVCWGANDHGQLGNGTMAASALPVPVFDAQGQRLTGVSQIAVGARHTCAVLNDRTAWCWGDNRSAQLGLGQMDTTASGGAMPVMTDSNVLLGGVQKLALGDDHSCALVMGGAVRCWGANASGQIGNPKKALDLFAASAELAQVSGAKDIAAGSASACAVLSGGTVSCWGDNSRGQLGDRTRLSYSAAPVQVKLATGDEALSGVSSIALGSRHACALSSTGVVHCWGRNRYGQMGNGQEMDFEQTSPRPTAFDAYEGTSLVLGEHHGCQTLADGTVSCWGLNERGQLGEVMGNAWLFSADPLPVTRQPEGNPPGPSEALADIRSVATGPASAHSCAVKTDGTAWCWGANGSSQLGDGSRTMWKTPVQVLESLASEEIEAAPLDAVTSIATGRDHTCALLDGGAVRCWGANTSGQLGNGTTTQSATPVLASGIGTALSIVAGEVSTCALLVGGTARCWGDNTYGQLGRTTTASQNLSPGLVGAISSQSLGNGAFLRMGGHHACAVLVDKTVRCWGRNDSGQLGDDTTVNKVTPTAVSGLTTVSSMCLGARHSCAVKADGSVWCWGNNTYGQLGDGTTTSRRAPFKVYGLNNAVAVSVSCGAAHTCVTLADGSAKCWGRNDYSQIGKFPGELRAVEGASLP